MKKRTVVTIVVDKNLFMCRRELGQFVTGVEYAGYNETIEMKIANTTLSVLTKEEDGYRFAFEVFGRNNVYKYFDTLLIEFEGEGNKEIAIEMVKRVQAYLEQSNRTHYKVLEYGIQVRHIF